MSEAGNKATILKFITEVFNHRDIDSATDFIFEGVVDHNEILFSQDGNPARIGEGVRRVLQAFPDFEARVLQLLADGDYVVARLRLAGTHTGEPPDNPGASGSLGPPTGKRAEWEAIVMTRLLEDGKIAEIWGISDRMGLYNQLGLLPPEH